MRVQQLSLWMVLLAVTLLPAATHAQDDDDAEETKLTESSAEFLSIDDDAIAALESSELSQNLISGGLAAMPNAKYNALVADIQSEPAIQGVSVGSPKTSYDVIIQPGHYGRTTGRVGTSGAKVSERALVTFIVRAVADSLADSGLKTLVVPADGVPKGITSKVFLAIHADGSENKCKVGPSMAYSNNSSLQAMHAIGFGLSRAFGYEYVDFMKDNYTVNESKYYMFDKVDTTIMEGLLEVGELTCQDIERRLIESAEVIGRNVGSALQYIVATQVADGQK